MDKLNKVINTTRKLIDLPYNRFNLENYFSILHSKGLNPITIDTAEDQPIKLMSGNNFYARIVTSNYHPEIKRRKIYIIGKGVLFDSGGLCLKDRDMENMTHDKAGAMISLNVANYLKGNVVAYCPISTNMIQNSRITPGDVIKVGKKKTVVVDTDAEGRLLLIDAINNLNASPNDIIITLATLTGCCEYAVDRAVGIFSENNDLLKKYAEASQEAGELAWALPLFPYMQNYYDKEPIRNYIKEIKAGASSAAMFIKQWIPYPNNWIHLDCARSSFDEQNRANGTPIRSLINFIRKLQ